jgi:hypothetical protein
VEESGGLVRAPIYAPLVSSIEAISPELALVDPELARVARALLAEPGTAWWREGEEAASQAVQSVTPVLEPVARTEPEAPVLVDARKERIPIGSTLSTPPGVSQREMPPAAAGPESLPSPSPPLTRSWAGRVARVLAVTAALAAFAAATSAITIVATSATEPAPDVLRSPAHSQLDVRPREEPAAKPVQTNTISHEPPTPRSKPLPPRRQRERSRASHPKPLQKQKKPPAQKQRSPKGIRREPIPPLAWTPVQKAKAYRVELRRHGTRIFLAHSRVPRLRLPRIWRYRRVTFLLRAGRRYTWIVRPLFGSKRALRLGRATVRATLMIRRS